MDSTDGNESNRDKMTHREKTDNGEVRNHNIAATNIVSKVTEIDSNVFRAMQAI